MEDARFRTFFGKLAAALRQELSGLSFGNLEVLNNFEIKNDYNVTVGVTLKNQMRVNVVCDFNFPSKAGPKIYATELYDSPVINKLTSEISYASFYLWTGGNNRVSDLLAKLEQYFRDNPPKKNFQLAEVNLMFRDVQNTVNNKLINLNYTKIKDRLGPEDEANLMRVNKLQDVIKGTSEYWECKAKIIALADKSAEISGEITSRGAGQGKVAGKTAGGVHPQTH